MNRETPKSCHECTNGNQDYYPCVNAAINEAKGEQAGTDHNKVWELVQEYRRKIGCIK